MNRPFSPMNLSRYLLLASALAMLTDPSWAQDQGSANAASSQSAKGSTQSMGTESGSSKHNDQGSQASNAGAYQQAVSDAKALAKANNLAAAERSLTKFNIFKANTADWHMETMQRLVHAANVLAQEGDPDTATALARQSLLHLDQAKGLTRDVRTQARAHALAGLIQQYFIGDPTAAIASYQAALQLAPDDAPTQEALDQLQKADANLRAKIHPGKL
jgi:tetratricopeptide (TPR) repeat protein